ncbi:MAG: helix-turn-helix domain-containing protein [Lentisphaeria bacterium]|nr:helix-turn-helix domain-containing protein [Lentisphaeria bacterium]
MLLTSQNFFSNQELSIQLFYTHSSSMLDWHNHEFTEIAIMFEGSCTYETDFSSSTVSKGDVLFIPREGNHRYRNEKNVSLMNVLFMLENLTFPYMKLFADPRFTALFRIRSEYCRKMQFYPRLKLNDTELAEVKSLLMPAWEKQEKQLTGATLSVYGAFLQIIPILLNAESAKYNSDRKGIPNLISETISKIHSHYKEKLSVPLLARKTGMSESSFTRHFKIATGETPVEYILHLRLNDAAEKISNGMPVSEAAFSAGFSDSNYFSRIFKQKIGISPRDIKKMPKKC